MQALAQLVLDHTTGKEQLGVEEQSNHPSAVLMVLGDMMEGILERQHGEEGKIG